MVDIAKIANITMQIYNDEYEAEASHKRARLTRQKLSNEANKKFEAAKNAVAEKQSLVIKAEGGVTAADNNVVTTNNKLVTAQAAYDTANATFLSANKNFIDKNNTYVEASAIMFDFIPKFLAKYDLKSIDEIDKLERNNVDFMRMIEIEKNVNTAYDSLPPAQEAVDKAKAPAETAKAALDVAIASSETAKASAKTAKAALDVAKANVEAAKIAEAAAKAEADAAAAAIDGPIDLEKVTQDANEKSAIHYAKKVIEERQKLKEEQDRQREKAEAEARKWDYLLIPAAGVGVAAHWMYAASRRGQREEKEFKELCENEVHRIEQLQNPININVTNFLVCADRLQTLERDITIQNCLPIKIFSRQCLAVANDIRIAITRFIDGSRLNVTLPGDRYYAALHQRARHIADLNLETRGECSRVMDILNSINTRIQQNGLCPPLEPQVNRQVNEEENDGLLGFMGGGKSLRKGGRRTKKRMYKKVRSTRKRHHRR
jgi:hypothetical protein